MVAASLPIITLAVAAVLFVIWFTMTQHRRHAARTQQRLCKGCGASHPAYANYCRRCGQRLREG